MIKIIITIAQLLAAESELQTKMEWSEAIDNVQDQMTWIREDLNNGRISEEQAEIYLKNLDRTEDLLIKLYNEKENWFYNWLIWSVIILHNSILCSNTMGILYKLNTIEQR